MSTSSTGSSGRTFRLAILAMLLSVWLLGRTGAPPEPPVAVELIEPVMPPVRVAQTKDEKTEPVHPPTVDEPKLGSVAGFVRFVGQAPLSRPINLDSDPYCQALYAGKPSPVDERFLAGQKGTLQNVLVYVSAGVPERAWPAPPEPAVVRLMGCRFEPHVTGVMLGQAVEFPNMDETMHSVHVQPKLSAIVVDSPPRSDHLFRWFPTRTEVGVHVKCDIHPWMRGYVHVLPHPFFSVTGADGTFHIRNLPAGEYELAAWHEMDEMHAQPETVRITVEPGEVTMIDLTMRLSE